MKVKEASKKFKKSKREIRECARQGLIPNAYKDFYWNIPDETKVIMSSKEIKSILYKIVQYKTLNNKNYNVCGMRSNNIIHYYILELLFKLDFIESLSEQGNKVNVFNMLNQITLTIDGLKYLFEQKYQKNINFTLLKVEKASIVSIDIL